MPNPFRFNLKILLTAFTLLCIVMGVWSYRANRQKLAVQAFLGAGDASSIFYAYQAKPGLPMEYDPKATPWAPQWLRGLFGDDYFITPDSLFVECKLPARSLDRDTMERLKDLPFLKQVSLFNVKLDDDSVSNLRSLTRLKFLNLYASDSSALGEVEDYSFLEYMPELQFLGLGNGKFDDDDAKHLARLTQLKRVFIQGSQVSDSGMENFSQLTKLEQLILNRSKVGDEGIAKLQELKSLETLWINSTQVTDASIPYLSKMTGLTSLEVRDTGITDEGVRRLREALPNCEVNENPYSGPN